LEQTPVIRFRLASGNTFEFRPIQAFQNRETFSPFDDQSLRTNAKGYSIALAKKKWRRAASNLNQDERLSAGE
jgi:hypothetical protein